MLIEESSEEIIAVVVIHFEMLFCGLSVRFQKKLMIFQCQHALFKQKLQGRITLSINQILSNFAYT